MLLRPYLFNKAYFININKNTNIHIYDDNSCDLLTTSPEQQEMFITDTIN